MQVHILVFDGRVEKASMDASKMYDIAKKMNGEGDPFGAYNVISLELEDANLTNATHPLTSNADAVYCGGCGYTHVPGTKCPTT